MIGVPDQHASPVAGARRVASPPVLIVDDADDLRMLLRNPDGAAPRPTVVGEAGDGIAGGRAGPRAPARPGAPRPGDAPDGRAEALPLIREAVPDVRVIVFSGFNQNTLAEKAMQAGADRYVVKGGPVRELLDLVASVLQPS